MISKQYGTVFTHSDYGKLRKVYSIWICPSAKNDAADTITIYRLKPIDLYGALVPPQTDYDLIDTVVITLTQNYEDSDSKIIRLLGTIFMPVLSLAEKESILENDYGIPMKYEMKEELFTMSNWSEGLIEIGQARGIEIGEGLGIRKGEIIGVIKICHDELQLRPEEIIVKIMERYQLTSAEAGKYVEETLSLQPA